MEQASINRKFTWVWLLDIEVRKSEGLQWTQFLVVFDQIFDDRLYVLVDIIDVLQSVNLLKELKLITLEYIERTTQKS